MSTIRLLKIVPPGGCLWTSLRESEGFVYERTLEELGRFIPGEDDVDVADQERDGKGWTGG